MKRWTLVSLMALGMTCLIAQGSCAQDAATNKAEAAENEVKVNLQDCPKAVQDTIKKEVGDGKVEDIARETEDGKTTYEVDAKIGDKDYEIKIAEDGTVISKEAEDEDDAKAGDDGADKAPKAKEGGKHQKGHDDGDDDDDKDEKDGDNNQKGEQK